MPSQANKQSRPIRTVECPGGYRYLVFQGSLLGDLSDFEPDKWYFQPIPAGPGPNPGEPYATAEDAERAVRARHA